MTPEIFAEWLRRQGHNVFKTESSFWYDAGTMTYQAFPYHWIIQPSEFELKELIRRQHAIGLRYSTPIEAVHGRISYQAIFKESSYSLDNLDRRSRQNVRRGLKNCRIESIGLDRLADEGWYLEADTSDRQNRENLLGKDRWRQKYQSARDLPGFEAWGALVGDRLVASILSFQMEDTIELISQQCHRDFMKDKVNNALAYTVTKTMISRTGIRSIFYTLQSLDAEDRVDEFKFRLGYAPVAVRQRVLFHPWILPFVNRTSYAGLRWLSKRWQDKVIIRKAEGMVRFYLSGSTSARDQDWPKCLSGVKEEMLSKLKYQVGL